MSGMNTLLHELERRVTSGETTYAAIGAHVGKTRAHIHGVIKGKHKMSLELAEQLADLLGFEIQVKPRRKKLSA